MESHLCAICKVIFSPRSLPDLGGEDFETGDAILSERIVESAKLWAISVSFGCVNSLISMPCRMSHASIDAKTRQERAMPEDLIRLCVGIEDVEDLIDDLRRAVSPPSPLYRDLSQTVPTLTVFK